MNDAPVKPSRAQRLHEFRRSQAPVIVWLVAAATVAALLAGRVRSHEFIGLARVVQYQVASPVDGRIEVVLVRELEKVEAEDIVVRLDDELLEKRIRTALAEAARLTAELGAERARLTAGGGPLAEGYSADLRRFRMDEAGRELEVLALRATIGTDEVERERLRLEADRADSLLEAGVLSETERDVAKLAHRQMETAVETNKALLASTEEEHRQASLRRQEFERGHSGRNNVEPALLPLEEAVKVQLALLEELRVEQKSHVLRSPVAGEVVQVLARKGQAVAPGDPIVVIAERIPAEIVAYLPEAAAGRLTERSLVTVIRRADPSRSVESVVTRVGSSIEMTPQQLWRDPRVPEYGLPVAIAAAPALALTPGEVVFVRSVGTR